MNSHHLQNPDLRVGRLDVLVPSVQGFLAVMVPGRWVFLNFQEEIAIFGSERF